jgi:calcium-dependent protein kinase
VKEIIDEIDYLGNGVINYTEFLTATMGIKSLLTEERLHNLFSQFDVDDTGFISSENLKEAFIRLGRGD